MTDITKDVRTRILRQKIQMWNNTAYDAQLDAEVAQDLGDEPMLANAKKRMKDAKRAAALLEQKLAEIENGEAK